MTFSSKINRYLVLHHRAAGEGMWSRI
jgi:hypothetical protein